MLTAANLRQCEAAVLNTECDRETRVRVNTAAGVQIGMPGVGEGDNRLTFPRRFLVGDALASHVTWIRFAKPEEGEVSGSWWRESEVQPKTLIHENGQAACPDQPMGMVGNTMTAIPEKRNEASEHVPCAEVDGISTPPTPSPR